MMKISLEPKIRNLINPVLNNNLLYVTICDIQGHHRSQVMVRNERLYMSSYL